MTGRVNEYLEPEIHLTLTGPTGLQLTVDVLVDTGFSEAVALPLPLIEAIQLPLQSTMPMQLADGSFSTSGVYTATILWNGVVREIPVHSNEGGALLGARLLHGQRLTVDVVDGGTLTIEPLPSMPGA